MTPTSETEEQNPLDLFTSAERPTLFTFARLTCLVNKTDCRAAGDTDFFRDLSSQVRRDSTLYFVQEPPCLSFEAAEFRLDGVAMTIDNFDRQREHLILATFLPVFGALENTPAPKDVRLGSKTNFFNSSVLSRLKRLRNCSQPPQRWLAAFAWPRMAAESMRVKLEFGSVPFI